MGCPMLSLSVAVLLALRRLHPPTTAVSVPHPPTDSHLSASPPPAVCQPLPPCCHSLHHSPPLTVTRSWRSTVQLLTRASSPLAVFFPPPPFPSPTSPLRSSHCPFLCLSSSGDASLCKAQVLGDGSRYPPPRSLFPFSLSESPPPPPSSRLHFVLTPFLPPLRSSNNKRIRASDPSLLSSPLSSSKSSHPSPSSPHQLSPTTSLVSNAELELHSSPDARRRMRALRVHPQ